jgi:hypothetical protein
MMIRMRPPKSKSRSCLVCLMNRPQVVRFQGLPLRPVMRLAAVVHGTWAPSSRARRLCRIIHLRETQTKGKIVFLWLPAFFIGRTRSANWCLLFKSAADLTSDTIKIRLKPSVRAGPSTDEMKSLNRQLSRWPVTSSPPSKWPKNLVDIGSSSLWRWPSRAACLLFVGTSNGKGNHDKQYERGKNSIHVVWASPNWSVDRFEALSVACDSSHGPAKLLLASVSAALLLLSMAFLPVDL